MRVLTYGRGDDSEVAVSDLTLHGLVSTFTVRGPGGARTRVRLGVPGEHNVLNATAALAVCAVLGADLGAVGEALATFGGARRRFEARGEAGGVRVFDDYAHHPTEVAALLRAAREVVGQGRVVVVFQPHLFSRTRIFAEDFGRALALADEVLVMDVYAAREDPEPGVSGRLITDNVPLPPERVCFLGPGTDLLTEVTARAGAGDLVLTVGAGDVTSWGPRILAALGDGRARAGAVPAPGRP